MSRREETLRAIVDAAENILRNGGTDGLTAGAVAAEVGLARNSLYRYVDSIDELRGMVVGRHIPEMFANMQEALESAADPRQALLDYTETNIRIASESHHAWLMRISEGISGDCAQEIGRMHRDLEQALHRTCAKADPARPADAAMTADLINGVIAVGFSALEKRRDPAAVLSRCIEAVGALLDARA